VDTVVSRAETRWVPDSVYADFNGNGQRDLVEPLLGAPIPWAEYAAMRDTANGGAGFDFDYDWDGLADPHTTVSLQRSVATAQGKAPNVLIYGQADATWIEVTYWAECGGLKSTLQRLILPIVF
jgi:hypothetical protein